MRFAAFTLICIMLLLAAFAVSWLHPGAVRVMFVAVLFIVVGWVLQLREEFF